MRLELDHRFQYRLRSKRQTSRFGLHLKQLMDTLQQFVFKNDRQVDDYFVRVIRGAENPNQQIIVYKTTCSLGGKQL